MSFHLGKPNTPSTNPQPIFGFGQPQQQTSGFSFGQPSQQQQQQQQTQPFGFTTPASSSSGFTFGSPVTPVFGFGSPTTSSAPSFGFGSSLPTASGTAGSSMFGSTTTTSNTPFNFSTPATSSGFSFGAPPASTSSFGALPASTSSVPSFGFGSIPATTTQSTMFSTGLAPQASAGSSFSLTASKSIASPFGAASSTFGTQATTSAASPFSFSFHSGPTTTTTQNATTSQPFGFGTVPVVASGTPVFGTTANTTPSSVPPSLQTAPSTTTTFGFPSGLSFGVTVTSPQNTVGTSQLSAAQAGLSFGVTVTSPQNTVGTSQLSATQAGFDFGLASQSSGQSETKPKSVSFDLPSSSVTSTPAAHGSGFIAISTPGTEVQPRTVGFGLSTSTATSCAFTAPVATTSTTSGITFGVPGSVPPIAHTEPKSKEHIAATTTVTGFSIGVSSSLPTTTVTATTAAAATTTSSSFITPTMTSLFTPSSEQPSASSNLFAAPAKTATPSSGTGFAFTPPVTSAVTTVASLTTAVTVTSSTVTPSPTMNFRQLEEAINKWNLELEEQERIFLNQATEVNAWDRLLVSNGEKITELSDAVEQVKTNQQKLDHELDFIVAQQRELEEILIPLEKSIESIPNLSIQQHADLEREHTYRLSENIDAQLKRMADDIKEIIEHLNSANSNQDENDPIYQVSKILNAHMDALQWIEQNTTLMQRKIDNISKQYDSQKRDQEIPFRAGYR